MILSQFAIFLTNNIQKLCLFICKILILLDKMFVNKELEETRNLMSEKRQDTKQIILGLILLAILSYIGWITVSFFIDSLKNVDAKIASTIIAGMFTIFAGLAAVIITQRQIKLREIQEAHREKKIEIYSSFITTATTMVAAQNKSLGITPLSEQELVQKMFDYKKEILLWGSPEVIKAQLEFERLAEKGSNLILIGVNNIYKAMRNDIGLSNSGLNNNELIKLFIIDPNEIDEMLKTSNKTS